MPPYGWLLVVLCKCIIAEKSLYIRPLSTDLEISGILGPRIFHASKSVTQCVEKWETIPPKAFLFDTVTKNCTEYLHVCGTNAAPGAGKKGVKPRKEFYVVSGSDVDVCPINPAESFDEFTEKWTEMYKGCRRLMDCTGFGLYVKKLETLYSMSITKTNRCNGTVGECVDQWIQNLPQILKCYSEENFCVGYWEIYQIAEYHRKNETETFYIVTKSKVNECNVTVRKQIEDHIGNRWYQVKPGCYRIPNIDNKADNIYMKELPSPLTLEADNRNKIKCTGSPIECARRYVYTSSPLALMCNPGSNECTRYDEIYEVKRGVGIASLKWYISTKSSSEDCGRGVESLTCDHFSFAHDDKECAYRSADCKGPPKYYISAYYNSTQLHLYASKQKACYKNIWGCFRDWRGDLPDVAVYDKTEKWMTGYWKVTGGVAMRDKSSHNFVALSPKDKCYNVSKRLEALCNCKIRRS